MELKKSFCLLTPPGRSAVATTKLHSHELQTDLAKLFLSHSGRPVKLKLSRPQFGFWSYVSGEKEGLVVCQLDDQTAEVHSHGGELAPKLIAQSLSKIGYSELTQYEQIQKQPSEVNVWRAEIQLALSQATTRKTALVLLTLLNCVDEKLEELIGQIRSDRAAAINSLERALAYREFGLHLTKNRSVVICGQPNVGKSSLINAVSGFARAIVHDSPGTTRDVVTEVTAFHGWPVELTDTAGIRNTDQQIESEGVRRAREELQTADVRVGMFDGSQPWSTADQELLDELNPQIVVHNKSDQQVVDPARPEGIWISALNGTGVENLIDSIVRLWADEIPTSELFPISESQAIRLKAALSEIRTSENPADGCQAIIDRLMANTTKSTNPLANSTDAKAN